MSLTTHAIQAAIANWNNPATKAIFEDASTVDPAEYRALFKAAARHPESETTRAFLYGSKFQNRALLSLREPDFDLSKQEIDLVTIHGNYPYAVVLFRHPKLKEVVGDELFYHLCRQAVKSPDESVSEAIGRNICFPIANLDEYRLNVQGDSPFVDPIEFAFFNPNTALAKGLAGNPYFPCDKEVIDTAIYLREGNDGKPTKFEEGLMLRPEYKRLISANPN